MKLNIHNIVLILVMFFGFSSISNAGPMKEVDNAMNQLKKQCRALTTEVNKNISSAKDIKKRILEVKGKLRSGMKSYSEINNLLGDAKYDIEKYLSAAYTFRSKMDNCNSWTPCWLCDLQDKVKQLNAHARSAQNAQKEYSRYTHYYSDAVDKFNKAIKIINE